MKHYRTFNKKDQKYYNERTALERPVTNSCVFVCVGGGSGGWGGGGGGGV